MGVLPATGTEISMGRMAFAIGVAASSTSQTSLNGAIGTGRNRTTGIGGVQASIPSGSQTRESTDFGGLTTPNNY
jgi:hypothetical protein